MITYKTFRISTIDLTQKTFFNHANYACRLAFILMLLMMPGTGPPTNESSPTSGNTSQATTRSMIQNTGHAEHTLENNISLDGVSGRTPASEQKPIDGSKMSCRPKIPKKTPSLKTHINDHKPVLPMNASTEEPNKVLFKLVLHYLQCSLSIMFIEIKKNRKDQRILRNTVSQYVSLFYLVS